MAPDITPIRRLLVANRGEIVVRVVRTAHRLGIETVGVYSEPDATGCHVDAVDLAVALGGASPAESYLRADAVIAAALATGCDAIHPGYGFLAENADFAAAVDAAGLVWVGPTPDQIHLLGDKVAAKKAAAAAAVPTAALVEVSADGDVLGEVTYPALVKAAAGGGGRGMRLVHDAGELADAIAAGSREALAAFGDGTVFIEPYIEHARHVEVQIFGDHHGNVVHLGERECSIQRRNQKVVEEAPSVGIDAATRQALCAGAVALASSVDYHGAGTVEFLVGADGAIDFLEVNTRLQVEHPVTEAVTGLDLVELQLLVASGAPLPFGQNEVTFDGHAIEVRVVAEHPAAGWLPSTGTLDRFHIGDGVRVDTGVAAGSTVTADYDSLLAKVVAHAPTRDEAARVLRRSLRGGSVSGVDSNVDALTALLDEPDFLAGRTTTDYFDDHPEVVSGGGVAGEDELALLVAVLCARERERRAADSVTGFAPSGWRNLRTLGQREAWTRGETVHHLEYVAGSGGFDVRLGSWPEPVEDGTLAPDDRRLMRVRALRHDDLPDGGVGVAIEVDGQRRLVDVHLRGDRAVASSRFGSATFTAVPRFADHQLDRTGGGPISPLPGTVIAVHVEVGQRVSDGDLLVVVEAMKMEHKIIANAAAMVDEVRFGAGDRVDTGDLLIVLRPLETSD